MPIGRYIPEFIDVAEAEAARTVVAVPLLPELPLATPARWGPGASWYALAALSAGIAVAAYAVSPWGPFQLSTAPLAGALQRPTISVVEFQNLTAGAGPSPQVAGLAIELVTDLEQFETIQVNYRVAGQPVPAPEDLPINDFVLTGIVRPDGQVVQYSAILTESRTGLVVWDQTLTVATSDAAMPGVLDRVSKSFSLVLGSPRGPLHAPARNLMMAPASGLVETNLYLCRVLFDRYRETGNTTEATAAKACFDVLPEVDKQSAMVMAANASLFAEYAGPSLAGDLPVEDRYRPAGDMPVEDRYRLADLQIQRALELDPVSAFVWEQQARLREAQGNRDLARADFASAVQLNPANADALAAFARLLALDGGLAAAEDMARDAAERSPDPPPWYFGVPALLALRDGDLALSIRRAELYAQADRELGPILAIMAAQRAGNSAVVNRYLPQVLDAAGFKAMGVLPRLRQRIGDDQLIDQIRSDLTQAGVPWATLTRPF